MATAAETRAGDRARMATGAPAAEAAEADRAATAAEAAELLDRALSADRDGPIGTARLESLRPHALPVLRAVARTGATGEAAFRAVSRLAGGLAAHGDAEGADAAASMLEEALALVGELELGDPFLEAIAADQLATALHVLGRPEASLAAARRAEEVGRRSCAPGEPRLLALLNNIGSLHKRRGDPLTAEVHFRRVVEAARRHDRPNPLVATGCLNLADVLRTRGSAGDALRFAREGAEETEALHGPVAFETADALSDLADALAAAGETEEAGRLLGRAALLFERRLGAEHPMTAAARRRREELEG